MELLVKTLVFFVEHKVNPTNIVVVATKYFGYLKYLVA